MGTWDRIRAALRREKKDLDEVVLDFEERANVALDQREREMHATPIEKLEIEQQRGDAIDEELDAVRRRIEGSGS
jgi:hypothetical protein